jgi:murein L,D-transpeptidase YcbB/YkuD
MIRKTAVACAWLMLMPLPSVAKPIDQIGGADGSTQTVHHCGFLAVSGGAYTKSPVLVGIIEHKLSALGYKVKADGVYGKADIRAIKQFQYDVGLAADGVVGPLTVQRLAQASHPSAHVRRCFRQTDGVR